MEYREPTPAECREFLKIAHALAKLGRAGCRFYLADDTLHLMAGPSHDSSERAQYDNVRESLYIPGAGGGGW